MPTEGTYSVQRAQPAEIQRVMQPLDVFSLMEWIQANNDRLIPPVSNETIYKGNDTFIVMVSGGPNSRKDYHYNESEELFLQLKGDIVVRIYKDGQHIDMPVREGDLLLIPPKTPHRPMRFANTYGLIIEKHRQKGERDGFLYFCEECGNQLYEEYFFLEDIVKQFPMIMKNFYNSVEHRTCKHCGQVMECPPGWEQNIEVRGKENEYAENPYADVHGKSW